MNDFILGPQVPISDNYFDQTFLTKARQHGEACPSAPPPKPLSPVEPQRKEFSNDIDYNRAMGTWSEVPVIKAWFNDLNSFELLHYYDLPLVVYNAHHRTGDASFLALARKTAGSWWQHPRWIDSGRQRLFPDSATPAPRHAGIGGLIEYALDGHPELWDWINAYVRAAFDTWIKLRIPKPDAVNPQLHYGLREGAFALQYAAWLVKVLPDSFPLQAGGTATNGAALRAQYLADIESACVNYFGRLQQADGSWRWNTSPDEPRDEDGGTWVGIMQPFMVGLMTSSLVDAHQVVVTPSVKTNIENQIFKACKHLYLDGPYARITASNFGVLTRGFHYFYHGGTSVNPTKYAKGDIPNPWPTTERWHVESARQAISTVLPAYGYAYKISGDPFYRNAGDELWDACYSGRDGFRGMMADTSKNFCQHARRGGSYLAWTGSDIVLPPLPTPAPTPAPPQPDPTPEPPPVSSDPVIKIVSPVNGATVSGKVDVVVEISDTSGISEIYLIVDEPARAIQLGVPYSLDTTSLSEGVHVLSVRAWKGGVAIDSKEKVNVTVKNLVEPTPEPIPDPTPVPTPRKISAPPSVTVPRNSTSEINVQLEGLTEPTTVDVIGSDGQVTVVPLSKIASPTSSILAFKVRTKNKKQVREIKFRTSFGEATTKVNVT